MSKTSLYRPGWRVWHPTALTFYVNGALYGVWATQIPLAKERLGLDPIVLSVVLLMLGAGAVLAMAGSGWIIQRLGTAALIRLSGVVFLALLPAIPLMPDVWLLSAVVFLFGASGGCMDVAMNADAARIEKQVGRPYMSSFHGMWSLGGLTGAGIATLMLRWTDGATQALIVTVVLAVIFAWGQRGLAPGKIAATADAGAGKSPSLRPAFLAVVVGLMAALAFSGEGVVLDWAAVFLREQLGAGQELANVGYAAFAGAMASVRFLGDPIRRHVDGVHLVRGGCLLALIGLLMGPLSGNVYVAILGYGLTGIGFANVVPVLFSTAGAMPRPEVQIATISTMGYAGLLAAPPLLGTVAHVSSLAGIFYVAAVFTVIIALLAPVCAPRGNSGSPAIEAG
ncbi:MFS transporter [Labrys sp. WJW]|uniref:MFS transporter n=1 Tax=Labrys sp. WJW TaxID=1737983 RepID=UPI000A701210|nr:MFS transporter [Labrys sp. WJW]